MRHIGLIIIISGLCATEPSLQLRTEHYLLITKSRLGNDPQVWQDTKNGYLRNRAIKTVDTIFKKIDNGESIEKIIGVDCQNLESFRKEIQKNEEYKLQINSRNNSKKTINYFSSSNGSSG